MTKTRQKAYKHGLRAETVAALYLMLRGYRILKMRYKTPVGEVDLVAVKKDMLVMVEVKARTRLNDALEAVNTRAQIRIEKAARYFLTLNPEYAQHAVRFDLIAFGRRFSFKHLDNAWMART